MIVARSLIFFTARKKHRGRCGGHIERGRTTYLSANHQWLKTVVLYVSQADDNIHLQSFTRFDTSP